MNSLADAMAAVMYPMAALDDTFERCGETLHEPRGMCSVRKSLFESFESSGLNLAPVCDL